MSSLNWVDNVILFVFLISVLAGLGRGLVKEVLSLLTWLAAFVVAALFSTSVASYFTGSTQVQSMVANTTNTIGINTAKSVSVLSLGISFVALFVGTLILGSIINALTSRAVERGGISFANRLLGAVFGLIRGTLIVLVGIFLVQLSPISQEPYWQASQFVRAYQPSVQWLSNIVEPGLQSLKTKVGDTLQNVNGQQFFH